MVCIRALRLKKDAGPMAFQREMSPSFSSHLRGWLSQAAFKVYDVSQISLRFKACGSQIQDSPVGRERAGALNSFMNTGQIVPCGKGSGLSDSISDSRSKKKNIGCSQISL